MNPLNDDLLTALRAARPDPSYQPAATSPEAAAMLSRILRSHRDPVPRVVRRRLLLAGLPAIGAVAAAAALAAAAIFSGPGGAGQGGASPGASAVRSAVLDAFQRDSGDIVHATRTIRRAQGPVMTQRSWTYPAFPSPGQRVRFRLFSLRNGVPQEDIESVYLQDAAASRLSTPTTAGPRTAEITDVEYATRTWSRQRSSSVLLAGSLSPSLIREQVAHGGFTVVGRVRLRGRQAVEITWSHTLGMMTVKTTLWVDARTYQPLRSVSIQRGPHGTPLLTSTTDLQILPATPANLRLLTPPIPAGFTRTAASPHF